MTYSIKTYPNETICFINFTDGENNAEFKGYLCKSNNILIESFRRGNIGKYQFQVFDDETDTFFFKGIGKGKKPQPAIDAMQNFISQCMAVEIVNTI